MSTTETKGLLLEGTTTAGVMFQANCVLIPHRGWLCSIYTTHMEERGDAESGPLGVEYWMEFASTYDTSEEPGKYSTHAMTPPTVQELADWMDYEADIITLTNPA